MAPTTIKPASRGQYDPLETVPMVPLISRVPVPNTGQPIKEQVDDSHGFYAELITRKVYGWKNIKKFREYLLQQTILTPFTERRDQLFGLVVFSIILVVNTASLLFPILVSKPAPIKSTSSTISTIWITTTGFLNPLWSQFSIRYDLVPKVAQAALQKESWSVTDTCSLVSAMEGGSIPYSKSFRTPRPSLRQVIILRLLADFGVYLGTPFVALGRDVKLCSEFPLALKMYKKPGNICVHISPLVLFAGMIWPLFILLVALLYGFLNASPVVRMAAGGYWSIDGVLKSSLFVKPLVDKIPPGMHMAPEAALELCMDGKWRLGDEVSEGLGRLKLLPEEEWKPLREAHYI